MQVNYEGRIVFIGLPKHIYFHCFIVLNKVLVHQIQVTCVIVQSCIFQKELDRTQSALVPAGVQRLPPHCAPLGIQTCREYASRQGAMLMNAS